MISREKKLGFRKLVRRQKRQAKDIGSVTEEGFDKHVFRRLMRLPQISRFLAGWLGLFLLLILAVILQSRALSNHYQTQKPQPGGTYTEGIIGTFTNANPLYASNAVDSSVSHLVFSGLLKYDNKGKLTSDAAESWSLDSSETVYTVKLRDNVKWHDGKKLTAEDVVFTYNLIQKPETKSYLLPSWRGVKVKSTDAKTVVFTLTNKLSAFPHSLTNGLVPKHVLAKVPPAQLRSHSFNNAAPIGSGPFKFSTVEVIGQTPSEREERIALNAFGEYHFDKPKLDRFVLRTFSNEKNMVKNYSEKRVDGMVGLSATPDDLANDPNIIEFGLPLSGEVLVFFKTNQDVLKDGAVRKALTLAMDKQKLFKGVPYPLTVADSPLLRSHIGYNKSLTQITNKPAEAAQTLDAAGWKKDPQTGVRAKDGAKLSFKLVSEATPEYTAIASGLQKQWHDLGVNVQVELQPDEELQTTVALHNYDALLYGVSLGPDPDVFAYWHSSQADPRSDTKLNFSEYKSPAADQALEAGRTRSDKTIREVKYKPFLETWRKDAPALALYQPRFLYVARSPFHGFDNSALNSAPDRYSNVHNWTVREGASSE